MAACSHHINYARRPKLVSWLQCTNLDLVAFEGRCAPYVWTTSLQDGKSLKKTHLNWGKYQNLSLPSHFFKNSLDPVSFEPTQKSLSFLWAGNPCTSRIPKRNPHLFRKRLDGDVHFSSLEQFF